MNEECSVERAATYDVLGVFAAGGHPSSMSNPWELQEAPAILLPTIRSFRNDLSVCDVGGLISASESLFVGKVAARSEEDTEVFELPTVEPKFPPLAQSPST